MLKQQWFYHKHIENAIAAFGVLFSSITLKRINKDNAIAQAIPVPVAYGPKQKFIARIGDATDLSNGRSAFEVVVPMMAFEITSMQYDSSRRIPPMQRVRAAGANGAVSQGFSWTPYNIGIRLSVLVKNQEDGLQIVEQILPYFSPDFNVPINELPDLGVSRNIQIVLNSVNLADDYEGDFSKRLYLVWDFDFTVKINLFGYIGNAEIIKTTIQNIYANFDATSEITSNSQAGEQIVTSVDPLSAGPTDTYTYMQEFNTLFFTTTTTTAP